MGNREVGARPAAAEDSGGRLTAAFAGRTRPQDWAAMPRAGGLLQRYGIVLVLVAVLLLAWSQNANFFEWSSFQTVLSQNAAIGVVAVGMTFVLIAGGIDISVGGIYAAGSVVYTKVGIDHSLTLALIAALAVGVALGSCNALLTTKLRFNAFVTTLGTGSIFAGGVVLYGGIDAIVPTNPSFGTLGNGMVGQLPYMVLVLIGAVVIGALLLHRTSFGAALYAVGGNLEASRLAGLRTDTLRALTYLISGACAALAGVLVASQTGVGQSNIGGNVALDAIVIVVIGGTSLFGGIGAMWRTGVGILILATINSLYNVLAISQSGQSLITGTILVLALAIDALTRRAS
ncbi:ABC transporter permease [Conexibacter sp. CPCC 206217]|uniref:ABC transporter permease n=1 Tax=Conexibacter sp. CPCC 206217 TaxID=3064574 RepID=UPI0027250C77|nr:ABC transporter permease [Conexibacter sp. CPCC 206217]MDO8212223.1 ABC transporter permease [Conexibacter sp. CPCC 206217]